MRRTFALACGGTLLYFVGPASPVSLADKISERARKLHFSSIVFDSYDDATQRLFSKSFELGRRNPDGHVDIPRMREGGMNALFFSIWIDGRTMDPFGFAEKVEEVSDAHSTC